MGPQCSRHRVKQKHPRPTLRPSCKPPRRCWTGSWGLHFGVPGALLGVPKARSAFGFVPRVLGAPLPLPLVLVLAVLVLILLVLVLVLALALVCSAGPWGRVPTPWTLNSSPAVFHFRVLGGLLERSWELLEGAWAPLGRFLEGLGLLEAFWRGSRGPLE